MIGYLQQAFADARVIELRVQSGERWNSGLFDSAGALNAAVQSHTGSNCYTSLNRPCAPSVTNAMGAKALCDTDIERIVRIPFDFDPVRPVGEPSTEAELTLAIRRRNALIAMLTALGWPQPATARSGNGAHALYRCGLANTTETRDMMTMLYRGLRAEYCDELVSFDPSVRNAARIWRLYGTVNRKGTATPERPHRLAEVSVPSRWEGVHPKQMEQLASRYARKVLAQTAAMPIKPPVAVVGQGDFSTLDVCRWFAAHGSLKRALGSGKHAVTCPWVHEHSTQDLPFASDTVVWEADGGWPSFHCSHAHCDTRTIRDVMRAWGDADRYCARAWRDSR